MIAAGNWPRLAYRNEQWQFVICIKGLSGFTRPSTSRDGEWHLWRTDAEHVAFKRTEHRTGRNDDEEEEAAEQKVELKKGPVLGSSLSILITVA